MRVVGPTAEVDLVWRHIGQTPAPVGLLALDATAAVDHHVVDLLTQLRRTATGPIAVVAVGINRDERWREQVTAQLALLDPERLLPVFAIRSDTDGTAPTDLTRWLHALAADPQRCAQVAALERRLAAVVPEVAEPDRIAAHTRRAQLRRELRDIRSRAEAAVDTGGTTIAGWAGDPAWLSGREPQLPRLLEQAFEDWERDVMARVRHDARRLQVPPPAAVGGAPETSLAQVCSAQQPPTLARLRAEDTVIALVGTSAGIGLGRLCALFLPLTTAGSIALIAVLGLGVGSLIAVMRRALTRRAGLAVWVSGRIAAARARLRSQVAAQLAALDADLDVALRTDFEREVARNRAALAARADRDAAVTARAAVTV